MFLFLFTYTSSVMNPSKMNLIIVATTKHQVALPWVRNVEGENCDRAPNSDVTKFVYKCLSFVEVIDRHTQARILSFMTMKKKIIPDFVTH